jgi:hypothetical protein
VPRIDPLHQNKTPEPPRNGTNNDQEIIEPHSSIRARGTDIARPSRLGMTVVTVIFILSSTAAVKAVAAADVAIEILGCVARQCVPDVTESRILLEQCIGKSIRAHLHAWIITSLYNVSISIVARLWLLEDWLSWKALAWEWLQTSLLVLVILALKSLFLQQGLDAYASSFAAEMTAEGIGTRKATATAPVITVLELATANKLLLARVESLVTLAVMLAGEGFATMIANERTLVCMGPKMRAQIVSASETLRTETALESGRMLLCSFRRV